MNDVYILQIETATPSCSAAISKNGVCIATVDAIEGNMHASHLTVFVNEVLEKANLCMADLSAIAVSKGPGSYTGLRIGVSAAKGLCYALDIPLLAINTLAAMWEGFMRESTTAEASVSYVPMIDARRMEVYMAIFDAEGATLEPTAAKIIDEDSFEGPRAYVLFGSGADKFVPLFESRSNVTVVPNFQNTAGYFSTAAYAKFQAQDFEDLVYFEPFYLKDFIAGTPKKRN